MNFCGAARETASFTLYLYSLEGQQRKRLTEGDWEVTEVAGRGSKVAKGSKKVYYVSTEASPLDRQLYSVKLNGKDRTRISHESGTHEISMSPTAEYYLDTFSVFSRNRRRPACIR